ncbi:MAG TPA: protein-glutamate O-methyltransferase CheR [Caulobacteraceae bacterium]|nr:protein-glutamate O-methyltransferase CheR [Caulobacteraceae bacterium]
MKAEEIAFVAALSRTRAGLKVAADKTYLIESRLAPLARRRGYDSISDLLNDIREQRDEALIWSLVEAMAAGETMFFRDRAPFNEFQTEMLPQLAKLRGAAPIRVWSAACASGQEIYSLAMLIEEMAAAHPAPRIELAASDLSKLALERAQTGLYDQFEVQRGLPIRRLAQHFEKEGDNWRISSAVRQRVRWRRINLIAGLRQIGRFDVVFCRHVLGHMTEDAQRKVLEDLTFVVPEDGYLVLGLNETIAAAAPAFQPVVGRPGLYRRDPAFRAAAA